MKNISAHSIYIIRTDIEDSILVLQGIKEVIDELPDVVSYDKNEFISTCTSKIMRKSRGSLNPMKISIILNNYLSDL